MNWQDELCKAAKHKQQVEREKITTLIICICIAILFALSFASCHGVPVTN
jgi:hypothetical protein